MNKILKFAVAGTLVLGLASCLKDDGYDEGTTGHDLGGVPKIIEMGFANEAARQKSFGLEFVDENVDVTVVKVRLAAPAPAPEDLTVTIDTTGAAAKIKEANANAVPLPNSFYEINVPASFKVVIPKGSTEASIIIKTNASKFNPSNTYGLFFKLTAVDKSGYTLSGNYGEYLVFLGAKNDYDGIYKVEGTFVDYTNATFMGNYPNEYYLVTSGPTSFDVSQVINSAVVPGYLFLTSPTAGSYFGNFGVTATLDPVTNKFSAFHNYYGDPTKSANAVGDPAGGSGAPLYRAAGPAFRTAELDPTGTNSYDPATRTFTVKYRMGQANVSPGNPRCLMTETWTYVRSR